MYASANDFISSVQQQDCGPSRTHFITSSKDCCKRSLTLLHKKSSSMILLHNIYNNKVDKINFPTSHAEKAKFANGLLPMPELYPVVLMHKQKVRAQRRLQWVAGMGRALHVHKGKSLLTNWITEADDNAGRNVSLSATIVQEIKQTSKQRFMYERAGVAGYRPEGEW